MWRGLALTPLALHRTALIFSLCWCLHEAATNKDAAAIGVDPQFLAGLQSTLGWQELSSLDLDAIRRLARYDKRAQKLNREMCTEENLHWDKLEPKLAAKALKHCGIVFFGPSSLHDSSKELLSALNTSAHELMVSTPKTYRTHSGTNRDGRKALIPEPRAPFDLTLLSRMYNSPVGETVRNYFDGNDPGLSYAELWWSPAKVPAQKIHSDDEGGSLIIFWLLDDLGTLPKGQNGEYLAIPGCFNSEETNIPSWCAKVEDKRVNKANFTKIDMHPLYQSAKAGSGFVYATNMLHAGAGNKSPQKKRKISVAGRSTDKS